ncbi:hypothetical protein MUG84_24615, partial [Paenibacillus sp. KQZ6P-2]|nr:hypothetical protein [Paenibacillus mangrovi]
SLQNWWDHLHWYEQVAILLGALALSMMFVGFGSALSIAMTGMSIAGSGHEIAGYIRDPKQLLTPQRAFSAAIGFILNRIPFGKALGWVGAKGRRYVRKLLDKFGSRKPKVDVPVHPKPPNVHARIPRTGAEWNDYYKRKYGDGNVTWVSELKSYDDILSNPKALWGKSADEVGRILGEGWKRGTYGSAGTGWKFTNGDKSVFYHPGGGVHNGSYIGFSSGQTGKVKVVGLDYKPLPSDKSTVIPK